MQYLLTPHVLFPHAHPPRSVTICKYFKNRPEPVLHIECGVCVLPKAVKAIENFLRGFCADLNISMNYIVVEFHTLNCLPHAIFLYTSCILYLLLYNNSIYELKHRYTVNNLRWQQERSNGFEIFLARCVFELRASRTLPTTASHPNSSATVTIRPPSLRLKSKSEWRNVWGGDNLNTNDSREGRDAHLALGIIIF